MSLYILLTIDGNGQGEVAATFLMANETQESIKKMLQIFQRENDCWKSNYR